MPKWSLSDPKVTPDRPKNGPKSPPNDPILVPKWSKNGRWLNEAGLSRLRPSVAPLLNKKCRENMLQWGRNWKKMLFFDKALRRCSPRSLKFLEEDNDPKRKSCTAQEWRNGICRMEWPWQSPDTSPTENVGAILRANVANHNPNSRKTLAKLVRYDWKKTTPCTLDRMHERVEADSSEMGQHTLFLLIRRASLYKSDFFVVLAE